MKNKKTNFPIVWNKAKTDKMPEGAFKVNINEPNKLFAMFKGEWVEVDAFKDLEERKVKK